MKKKIAAKQSYFTICSVDCTRTAITQYHWDSDFMSKVRGEIDVMMAVRFGDDFIQGGAGACSPN